MVRIGSLYGGHTIEESLINKNSIIYSFGLGEDGTFDLGLLHYGCYVNVFDPTPKSIAYFNEKLSFINKLRFYDIGVYDQDINIKFYSPTDPTHVSHSIGNLQNTEEFFIGRVNTLQTIMKILGDKKIDLLKLDIEGAEYAVFCNMQKTGILPKMICVEFHGIADQESIDLLLGLGYKILFQSITSFTFIKE